jgi:poly [ADP-ribose] polymerase 2/3/4
VKYKGKYDIVEMDVDSLEKENPDEDEKPSSSVSSNPKKPLERADSTIDERIQKLISSICNVGMWEDEMRMMEIDTRRMPLGKLSKSQLMKGYKVLKNIEAVLLGARSADFWKLEELSSDFYTTIPHDCGMRAPPVISSLKMLQERMKVLEVSEDASLLSWLMH